MIQCWTSTTLLLLSKFELVLLQYTTEHLIDIGISKCIDDTSVHIRHENDVEQQVPQCVGMLKHAAAEFDNGGRVAKRTNPSESLNEGVGLLDGSLLGSGGGWSTWLARHGRDFLGRGWPRVGSSLPGKPMIVATKDTIG